MVYTYGVTIQSAHSLVGGSQLYTCKTTVTESSGIKRTFTSF